MSTVRTVRWVSIVGARPQFIKIAPLCKAIAAYNREHDDTVIIHRLIHTGQHYDREMADLMFTQLEIPDPVYNLGVGSGSHGVQLGRLLEKLEPVLSSEKPDWVLVYGDTNSTLGGALMAVRLKQPVAHIEAGCRSFNRAMPEEQNRVVVDHLSKLLLAPSKGAVDNLAREGIGTTNDTVQRSVLFVGDLMLDALTANEQIAETNSLPTLDRFSLSPRCYYLLTLHRAENTDDPRNLQRVFEALNCADYPVIFPVHPRTRKVLAQLSSTSSSRVQQIAPLSYLQMLTIEKNARKILTDSGGVQKEAFYLKVPCITLRKDTEWPETVEAGANMVVGVDTNLIITALLAPPQVPNSMHAPFGDGHASERVISGLLKRSGCTEGDQ